MEINIDKDTINIYDEKFSCCVHWIEWSSNSDSISRECKKCGKEQIRGTRRTH